MKHLAKSVPNQGKSRNGDHFRFYEDEQLAIACLADGVGGAPCDWKASEQACNDLIYHMLNTFRDMDTKSRIAHSLKEVYTRIYGTEGECAGMLSTLVGLIVDKTENQYYYFGIGDSEIWKFGTDSIEKLSNNTSFKIPPERLLNIIRTGGALKPNTTFALMSDGFSTNRKQYKYELALVANSEDWKARFDQLFQLNQVTQSDDLTLMLLKS